MGDWRDRVLDRIADDYERGGEQAKADRLRHFLRNAREIEACDLACPGQPPQAEQWAVGRLDELAHGRPVTTIGVYYRAWLGLTGEFRIITELGDDAPHDTAGWLPVVEGLETELGKQRFPNDYGHNIALASRRLTIEERTEVIATPLGVIRQPHLMAMYLLWLACRPTARETFRDFRAQLERYEPKAAPVPLTAPPASP